MLTGDSAGWWNQASEMLETALTAKPTGYDALIVDEAQDFQCAVWLALEKRNEAGRFYLLGSVSPELVKGISESLAGRVGVLDLTPFVYE